MVQFADFLSPIAFRYPDKVEPSGWTEHIPFAFWLMERARPRQFVELGVYHGVSYLAFCQSAQQNGLATKCFGVDTWEGDEHAGFYGDEVYDAPSAYHDIRYSNFSQLIRSTFVEALDHFGDGSVDLLHIDGRHRYSDVKSDFESWLPKLSDRAVVLLHDINVHRGDFGVDRFWNQLIERYPENFEFHHGNGLGIIGIGADLPAGIRAYFATGREEENASCIRAVYSRLGRGLSDALVVHEKSEELLRASSELRRIKSEFDTVWRQNETERDEERRRNGQLLQQRDAELSSVKEQLRRVEEARDVQLRSIYGSTSWRITRPLRAGKRAISTIGKMLPKKC